MLLKVVIHSALHWIGEHRVILVHKLVLAVIKHTLTNLAIDMLLARRKGLLQTLEDGLDELWVEVRVKFDLLHHIV